jgi:hypothetical protein
MTYFKMYLILNNKKARQKIQIENRRHFYKEDMQTASEHIEGSQHF